MQKVTLAEWAAARYKTTPPSLFTLRRWAREGQFWPPASRDGKSYYVNENAERMGSVATGPNLLDRIAG